MQVNHEIQDINNRIERTRKPDKKSALQIELEKLSRQTSWLNNQLYCLHLDTVGSLYTLRPYLLKSRRNHTIKGHSIGKKYDQISGDTITYCRRYIDFPTDTIFSVYPHYRASYWDEFFKVYFYGKGEVIEPPKDSLSNLYPKCWKGHIISKELNINIISINPICTYSFFRKWRLRYKKLLFKEYYKYAKSQKS